LASRTVAFDGKVYGRKIVVVLTDPLIGNVESHQTKLLKRYNYAMAKHVICKVTNAEQQQAETYGYWHSLPVGNRFSAVWDISEAAFAFAAAFKGNHPNDAQGSERTITRIPRSRG
jgi:hypothetical protein